MSGADGIVCTSVIHCGEHDEQFPDASHEMQVVPSVTLMVEPSEVTVDFDASPPLLLKKLTIFETIAPLASEAPLVWMVAYALATASARFAEPSKIV